MAKGHYDDAVRKVARARAGRDVGGALAGPGAPFDPTVPTAQGGKPASRRRAAVLAGRAGSLGAKGLAFTHRKGYHPGDDTNRGA